MVKLEWSTTESLQVTGSSQEPELSPLKKAVDFLPNQKALLIHTDESVPGFDEREAIYTLMPMQHPLLSLVGEIYSVSESWVWAKKEEEKTVEEKKTECEKEREKGGPKITVRENGPGPVGVEAKTVLLSRALELAIKARNLPAVLLITHVSTTEGGLARGTRKAENLNIEILQMNQRAAAFAMEALAGRPLPNLLSQPSPPAYIESVFKRFLELGPLTKNWLYKLFNYSSETHVLFDSHRNRPAADLYYQFLHKYHGQGLNPEGRPDIALWYNAGLSAKNYALDRREAKDKAGEKAWWRRLENIVNQLFDVMKKAGDKGLV